MSRDADRGRVYAAEAAAFTGTLAEEPVDDAELARLVAAVVEAPVWAVVAGGVAVAVVAARADASRSSARPGPGGWQVRVAAGQASAATVAHELAHVVAGTAAGHGPAFRRAHLDVTGLVGGERGRAMLAEAYAAHGLAVPPPDGRWPVAPRHGALGDVVARRGARRLQGHEPADRDHRPPDRSQAVRR